MFCTLLGLYSLDDVISLFVTALAGFLCIQVVLVCIASNHLGCYPVFNSSSAIAHVDMCPFLAGFDADRLQHAKRDHRSAETGKIVRPVNATAMGLAADSSISYSHVLSLAVKVSPLISFSYHTVMVSLRTSLNAWIALVFLLGVLSHHPVQKAMRM